MSYLLPAIEYMLKNEDLTITNRDNKSPYILVLGPTRELVEQIYNCALITSLGLNIKVSEC